MLKRVSVFCIGLCTLALLLPSPAWAQDERRFEASGGFTYIFADVGGGVADLKGPGFNGEFAYFLNDWFGLGAEVGYNQGSIEIPPLPALTIDANIDFSQWTLLFGPRFRLSDSERFRVGAQAMAGLVYASTSFELEIEELIVNLPGGGTELIDFPFIDVVLTDTAFAAMFGIHFDWKINDRVFWRIVQPDVLISAYGGEGQANFRIASGLGFEF